MSALWLWSQFGKQTVCKGVMGMARQVLGCLQHFLIVIYLCFKSSTYNLSVFTNVLVIESCGHKSFLMLDTSLVSPSCCLDTSTLIQKVELQHNLL